MSAPPVVEAHEARITIDGVIAVDRLSLVTTGDRVVFAGDTGALFAVLTGVPRSQAGAAKRAPAAGEGDSVEMPGEPSVAAGSLLLAGKSVSDGSHVPLMGAAPLDPPMPPRWTAEEYVVWGARLAGAARGAARDMAAAALARTGLAKLRRRTTGTLSVAERRALTVAQAIAAGPEVLVAEAPLSGLEGADADLVQGAVAVASEGRRAAISVARLDAGTAEGALARSASHLVVLAGGEAALEGPPGELFAGGRLYALTVRSNAEALRAALSARGIDLRGGPTRFSAALPAGATTVEILKAAQSARAAVVEMVPLIG